MKWIDRAERKLGHLAIPHLLHGIAFFIACAYVLSKVSPHFVETLALDPDRVKAGEVWRLVTYLFIPPGRGLFLPDWAVAVFYVSFLLWMGNGLEQAWGAFRVTVYSLISMVGITVAAFFLGVNFSTFMFVQSLFLAFARFYPEEWIYIYFILPVKIKWLAWLDGVLLVLLFTFFPASVRVTVIVTLGNYFLFFGREIIDAALHRHETADRRRRFYNAVRPPDDEAMHHCATCGRTEIQAPDLEFRVTRDGQEYCLEHLPKTPPPTTPA